jgi:hypothetical protein
MMRPFAESEQALLRVVDQFDQVAKYQGLAPEEFLVGFGRDAAERLLDEGLVEKVKLKSFGQKVKGLRFTEPGRRLWLSHTSQDERLPVITRMGLLVRDIYLANRLSHTGEAVPKDQVLRHHARGSLLEAFEAGMVAKVKISQKHQDVVKGYIITPAGYAYLKGNKLL